MKIGIFGIDSIQAGKANIKDERVDALAKMFNSGKKVYIQADLITDREKIKEADGIICPALNKDDLIISDMEFVDLRLERSSDEAEKKLMARFKDQLDKVKFLSELEISAEENKFIAGYPLLTVKPVYLAAAEEVADRDKLLPPAYAEFGYISYFTAGDKDSHAWSLKKGANAWEAAGCIHSDIQKGFIRAEVVSYADLISAGSLSQARNNNKISLENKEYIVRDGDYIVFKCNK